MLFRFAGSDHSKYTQYHLEFICVLEFESSPSLRDSILKSLLVNLSGDPGRFSPADLIQEYFNRLLQAIAERKGVEYNAHFVRNVVSRNLHHLARLRDDLKEGVGLAERSSRHGSPKKKAEIRKLLHEYEKHELHSRCPGRTFVSVEDSHKVSDFRQGLANLRSGKLEKWINESTFMQGTGTTGAASASCPPDAEQSSLDDGEDEGQPEGDDLEDGDLVGASPARSGLPSMRMVGGELVVEELDVEDEAEVLWSALVDDMSDEDSDSVRSENEQDE